MPFPPEPPAHVWSEHPPPAVTIPITSRSPRADPGALAALNATGCFRKGKKHEISLTPGRKALDHMEQSERCKIRQINPTSRRSTMLGTGAAVLFLEIKTKRREAEDGGGWVQEPLFLSRGGTEREQVAGGGGHGPGPCPLAPPTCLPPAPRPAPAPGAHRRTV